ncbi:DUF1190 domain-containing protein [Xanthobacter sp. YC-JY1]|uniref:DUF1190 domain-containing protein n=1 Tax=Xanthobacter sp. YC-JY1 TaxID=2419844 RepID=UPI00273A3624|nr:DUF1190 domain-containing protein [Xanthobacter sp. YC-JY1]UJX46078.1 DUF1190 domain-containing protein [Xanthobacter sp. YC-JY1]
MKRSTQISLGLLLGGTVLTFYACSGPDEPAELIYEGNRADAIRQCLADDFPAQTCATAYAEAQRAHTQSAPRFTSRAECERATDSACDFTVVKRFDGTLADVVVPVMTGFLLSQALPGREANVGTALYRSLQDPTSYRQLSAFVGVGAGGGGGTFLGPTSVGGGKSIGAGGRGGFGAHGSGGKGGGGKGGGS